MSRGIASRNIRTGLFIKNHLQQVSEDYIENIHRAYKDTYKADWITNHPPNKIFHGHVCTYASFNRYFHHLISWGLVVFVREDIITMQSKPTVPALIQADVQSGTVRKATVHYYSLTQLGQSNHPAWENPAGEFMKQHAYV